ncbi:MAG: response regulator [Candidatus Xenobiia bacterium LiM19]
MEELKSILLVEDDPKDVELSLIALSDCNLANEIAVARDGAEALDYLYRRGAYTLRPQGNPVVILLDLKMPKVDGIQVLKTLKSDEQMCSIPIVILTSSREARDLDECYKLGVNSFVVKPVHFSEFTRVIKQVGVFWALINEPPLGSSKRGAPHHPESDH